MNAQPGVQPGAEGWTATGSGDRQHTVVVLVHGFTGNPKALRPLATRLHHDGFSVDLVRLPGHGTSPRDMARTRYSDWRTAVTAAVDRGLRDQRRVILLGHSMGGTIALDLAGHRDDVTAVVAINPLVVAPDTPLAPVAGLLQYVVPMVPRQAAGLPTDDIARPGVTEDAYPRVPAKSAQSLLANLGRVRDGLAHLDVPLLLVSSRVDHTVAPINGDIVAELAATDDLCRWYAERSWHLPQVDWERDEVEALVTDFVADVHDRAGR